MRVLAGLLVTPVLIAIASMGLAQIRAGSQPTPTFNESSSAQTVDQLIDHIVTREHEELTLVNTYRPILGTGFPGPPKLYYQVNRGGLFASRLLYNDLSTPTTVYDAGISTVLGDERFKSGASVYDVKSFGAVCDGVTDDTAAITAAYTQAAADLAASSGLGGGGTVYFPHSSGPCKFSTLTVPNGPPHGWIVSLFDNSLLGNTINVNNNNAFIGRSGNNQGATGVFQYGPAVTWSNASVQSGPFVNDSASIGQVYFEGISMVGATTSETLLIQSTQWITMVRCMVQNTQSGFDVLAQGANASSVGGFGFQAEYSSFPGANTLSFTNFGQININHSFIGNGSVYVYNAGIPDVSDISFDDVQSEGLTNADFLVIRGTYVTNVTLRDVKLADTVGTAYVIDDLHTGNPFGPIHFDMEQFIGSGLMDPAGNYLNIICAGIGCPSNSNVGQTMPTIVASLPSASANPYAMIPVSDSTSIAAEGQTCVGGSSNKALAFSNGSVWKCF
jgi:hypothetical protein